MNIGLTPSPPLCLGPNSLFLRRFYDAFPLCLYLYSVFVFVINISICMWICVLDVLCLAEVEILEAFRGSSQLTASPW